MDITFHCPNCEQELEVDLSGAGQMITCPTCNNEIQVPNPDVMNVRPMNPIAASAAAKIEKHFKVPVHDAPSEILVKKVEKEDEVAPSDGKQRLRMRVIRHSDCIEVGHDTYEHVVGEYLNKVGEANIVSITPLSYTHVDIGTQKILTDYAIQIIYRG